MLKNNKKVLYFEGAGWEDADISKATIGNCRIRTAFINNKGKKIYLEISAVPIYKGKIIEGYRMHIDHVFYITDDKDDCNNNRISFDWKNIRDNYNYSKEDITKWINKHLDCSFDTIEVLPQYEGYRVHGDNGTYNLIDNHNINLQRAKARKEAYNKIDKEYRKLLNEKYSKISMLEMDENSITVKCYASDQSMLRAGLTKEDRIKKIEVIY